MMAAGGAHQLDHVASIDVGRRRQRCTSEASFSLTVIHQQPLATAIWPVTVPRSLRRNAHPPRIAEARSLGVRIGHPAYYEVRKCAAHSRSWIIKANCGSLRFRWSIFARI